MPTPRHAPAEEDGFTVVELLVVMSLFTILTGVFASGIIGGFRAGALVRDRTQAMSELQVTVERAAREIRAAAPVQVVTTGVNRSIHVRTVRSGSCARVTYRVEGTELAQYTHPLTPAPPPPGTEFNASTCASPAPVDPPPVTAVRRVLVRDLASGTGFVYRRADGTVMNFSLTGASRPREAEIRTVELTVRRTVPRGGAVQVQTTVLLRNQRGV